MVVHVMKGEERRGGIVARAVVFSKLCIGNGADQC